MTDVTTAPPQPAKSDKRLLRREFERPPKSTGPRVPHTLHLRELKLPDGRKLLLDRRGISFICEARREDFAGKDVVIIGFKTMAKACPVLAVYDDVRAWWWGASWEKGSAPK